MRVAADPVFDRKREQDMSSPPKVSVIIPCRNEVRHIEACIRSAFAFKAPEGGFEVIVVDGMSNDGTRDILSQLQRDEYPELRVIDNPGKTVPQAMNLGIRQASGEYVVRIDSRCFHPREYLLDLLDLSGQTGADSVGGVLYPLPGRSFMGECIALAYWSRISMGGGLRARQDFVGEAETAYGGCFKKARLIEVGLYDEQMVRNQDDELSFRLRKRGGRIFQSSRIQIVYYPRRFLTQVFRQFMQYGYWKVAVIRRHPRQASVRHFMPVGLVGTIGLGSILSLLHPLFLVGWMALTGSYLTLCGVESFRITPKGKPLHFFGIWTVIMAIHFGFGLGFLLNSVSLPWGGKFKWFETLTR
jgi:glycosyltransferase involved in cell wall biosynthesis